jgi:hypothetical protein
VSGFNYLAIFDGKPWNSPFTETAQKPETAVIARVEKGARPWQKGFFGRMITTAA